MNILYIAHRIPYPPNKGDKIRAYHELRSLSEVGNVFLCALVDDPDDWQYQKELEVVCKEVALVKLKPKWKKIVSLYGLISRQPMSVLYFYESLLQKKINAVLENQKIDTVICFSGTSAEYLFRAENTGIVSQSKVQKRPKLIMDFCDVDSLKWAEYGTRVNFPFSWLYSQEGVLLSRYEKKVAEHFDCTVIVSEREAQLFGEHIQTNKKPVVINNGLDADFFKPTAISQPVSASMSNGFMPELLFTGAMDYHANVDGVCWFIEHIWGKILAHYPKAQFTIAGRNPTDKLLKLHKKNNVFVTGEISDVRPYYHRATLVVVPLLIARGIQNKVLEALAMEKPVVCSKQAFEGIEAKTGEDILVADGDLEFSEAVLNLLADAPLREKIGKNARRVIENNYKWEVKMADLISLLN